MSSLDFSPLKLDLVGIRAGDSNKRIIQFLAGGAPWDGMGHIDVLANGNVQAVNYQASGTSAQVSLEPVQFHAEA